MMNTIFAVVRSLVGYSIIGLLGLVCSIPCLLVAALPERWRFHNSFYYRVTDFFYKGVIFASGISVKIRGKNHVPKSPAIIIANHQSAFDIPLVGCLLQDFPHVWLFLSRYAKYPIFGFLMRRMNIVVDHAGLKRLTGSIYKAIDVLKEQQRHVVLFPEGGRHVDGAIHKFFYGFALLAEKTHKPVVPVLLCNVYKVYPPGAFLVRPHQITIVVGKPFLFQDDETQEQFVARVHTWFVEQSVKEG